MEIKIRKVEERDKSRIFEISSKIWGGNDYIPFVFEEWVKDPRGYFVCAEINGKIAGFGRCVKISNDYFWLEGLRADRSFKGKGIGESLTKFFIEKGSKEGAKTIALSTYIDNKASIHIIEKNGFRVVSQFVFFETIRRSRNPEKLRLFSTRNVENINIKVLENYILKSNFIKRSNGYFPFGWKFVKTDLGLEESLKKASVLLGYVEDGALKGAACGGEVLADSSSFSTFFIDGTETAVENLLKSILNLKRNYKHLEFMVPSNLENLNPLISTFKKYKIRNYNNYIPDVFVYEKKLN